MLRFLGVFVAHQVGGALMFLRAIAEGWIALALFAAVWVGGAWLVARLAAADSIGHPFWVLAVGSVSGTGMAMLSMLAAGRGVHFLFSLLAVITAGIALLAPLRKRVPGM